MKIPKKKLKLAVLLSGSGSNLQAMIDRIESGKLDGEIGLVVSNNPDAYGLLRARNHGIPCAVVDYKQYGRKRLPKVHASKLPEEFGELMRRQRIFTGLPREEMEDRLGRLVLAEKEIISLLTSAAPDLICLAGYMRLLTPYFIGRYQGKGSFRIMNIHPALLPAFPGERGYEDTFNYGCRFGGVTVHFVDEGEDTGPIIAQAIYPIWPKDTLDSMRKRGLQLEYELYSQCIQWMAQGDLQVVDREGERPRVRIIDPEYPEFLGQLVRQAFEQ